MKPLIRIEIHITWSCTFVKYRYNLGFGIPIVVPAFWKCDWFGIQSIHLKNSSIVKDKQRFFLVMRFERNFSLKFSLKENYAVWWSYLQ